MKSLKQELREKTLEQRDALSEQTRREYAAVIMNCVLSQPEIKEAKGVFCFVGFGSEPDTTHLILRLLEDGKRVFIPRTEKGNPEMKLAEIDSLDELEVDYYGILSPKADHPRWGTIRDVDAVIVPGVAFDTKGYRVGYGAGFYDRFLADDPSVFKLAIGYALQLTDSVPKDDHDIPVDALVTEMGIRRFTGEQA